MVDNVRGYSRLSFDPVVENETPVSSPLAAPSDSFLQDGTVAPREEAVHLWDRVLENIRQRVNEQTYNTWFAQTEFVSIQDDCLKLQGPNQFFVDWLTEHHYELLTAAARHVLGPDVTVQVHVDPNPSPAATVDPRPTPVPEPEPTRH